MTLPVAYVAGLIDGEGCIWINKTSRGYYSPCVTVGMTSRALMILESLKEQYGGSVNQHSPATKKWDASYAWRVSGEPAVQMLTEILPDLILKPQQARLAIRLQEVKDQHGGKFSPCVAERCEKIKQRMHMLNARGPRTPEPEPPTGYRKVAQLVAGLWVTDQGDLFSDLGLEPFRGTWPKSGMVRSGVLYEPVTPGHPTAASESSYLPTPTSQLNEPAPWKPGVQWWLQSRATRNLEGVVTGNTPLLPTPDTTHQRKETRTSILLPGIAEALLDTPRASDGGWDGDETGKGRRGSSAGFGLRNQSRDLAKLLPTPAANDSGNSPEVHLSKKPGRTQVTSLAIITENGLIETGGLLPTPSAGDGTGGHSSRSGERRSEKLLGGLARDLLPTPRSAAGMNDSMETARARLESGARSRSTLEEATAMMPTPNSRDWKGSPSSAWSGQASLPRTVSRIGDTTSPPSGAGKPSSDGQLPGQLSLDQVEE